MFLYAGATSKGLYRSVNEDTIMANGVIESSVSGSDADCCYGVVCDGVSSCGWGQDASMIAARSFSSLQEAKNPDGILRSIRLANKAVMDAQQLEKGHAHMATTVAGFVARKEDDQHVYGAAFHVGDSRVYLFRNNHLYQLGQDHSYAAAHPEVVQDQLTEEQKHTITACLGRDLAETHSHIRMIRYRRGDIIVATSDGLHGCSYAETRIERTLLRKDLSLFQKCEYLVEWSITVGSRDNISIIAMEVV